jgi:hypothetical protein
LRDRIGGRGLRGGRLRDEAECKRENGRRHQRTDRL